jgi:hypothetical protein
VYSPDVVARAILHAAEHPERDVFVGGGGKVISTLGRYAPRLADRYMERTMFRQQQRNAPPHAGDNLGSPSHDLRERGDHPGHVMRSSVYTQASEHPWLTALAVGAIVATGISVVRPGADWDVDLD